ncbi:hypothetical protein ACA910_009788 [Epithemia clementina (nom. ined.)]
MSVCDSCNVQISEQSDCYALSMDLPGVRQDNILVAEQNYCLTIEAVRLDHTTTTAQLCSDNHNEQQQQQQQQQQVYCKFCRTFLLDKKSVNRHAITACLSLNGVLTVNLPRLSPPQALQVTPVTTPCKQFRQQHEPPQQDKNVLPGDIKKGGTAGTTQEGVVEYEKQSIFHFSLELPGVHVEDLKIHVTGCDLTISTPDEYGSGSIVHRFFTIDDHRVDPTHLSAHFVNGVLC